MTDEIWRWDATRMAEAIARRQISSRDAVESCLARMAAVNPRLTAVTVDLSAPARQAADRADAAVARGDTLGPLHGVPVTVKENIDQAGCATTNGIVAFRDLVAKEDSPVVANWTAAGAIILGRTNTPGFSFRLDTENDLRGRTYNPWSETHTPGGSSGGAASSVAAGITPLAHGNDIAGSIRYPAYACGLAGLRPSFGRVPAFNPSSGAERSMSAQLLSVQGPLARTVRDIRLALATMAARDVRDPWWVDAPLEGRPPPRPIRVAVVTEPEALGGARLAPDGGRGDAPGRGLAGRGRLRDRGRAHAGLHAGHGAVARDAAAGDPGVPAAGHRAVRRPRHPAGDAPAVRGVTPRKTASPT